MIFIKKSFFIDKAHFFSLLIGQNSFLLIFLAQFLSIYIFSPQFLSIYNFWPNFFYLHFSGHIPIYLHLKCISMKFKVNFLAFSKKKPKKPKSGPILNIFNLF